MLLRSQEMKLKIVLCSIIHLFIQSISAMCHTMSGDSQRNSIFWNDNYFPTCTTTHIIYEFVFYIHWRAKWKQKCYVHRNSLHFFLFFCPFLYFDKCIAAMTEYNFLLYQQIQFIQAPKIHRKVNQDDFKWCENITSQ